MRTTLTLDPDVEAMLTEYRQRNALGLKEAVNEALRHGLQSMQRPSSNRKPFSTKVVDHGRTLRPNVDDVAEILEGLEKPPA